MLKALEWVELQIASNPDRKPVLIEEWGKMDWRGVTVHGRIDRLDRLADGSFAVVDYKTGGPPSVWQVEAGFALQLGTLGLMVEHGAFPAIAGEATRFEYCSLGSSKTSETGFGYIKTPLKVDGARSGLDPDEFLPKAQDYLDDALNK